MPKNLEQWPTTRYLTLNDGAILAYTVLGEEKTDQLPLVLICGMYMTKEDWRPFCDDLARTRRVLIFDNRGIGHSRHPRRSSFFTLHTMASDTIALIEHLAWRDVAILGFSMGGMVAQIIASLDPPQFRLHHLILAATSCRLPSSRKAYHIGVRASLLFAARGSFTREAALRFAKEFLHLQYTRSFVNRHPEIFNMRFASFTRRRRPIPTIFNQWRAIHDFNVASKLVELRVPTLIIHGTHDQMVAYEEGKRLAALIKGANLHTVHRGGHMFFDHEPEIVAVINRSLRGDQSKL
ncbi:uncharacterized protein VTP21DRAFT_4565 [Calcarisporiella thermophila]|uniref:uncharacterized protein n=1 Tax=Calcarisporiella thermophila TaxID=911321 RepID=UPI00374236DC